MKTLPRLWLIAILNLLLIVASLATASSINTTASASSDYPASWLQYEWSQLNGDPSFTKLSAGPGPDSPNIMWKANLTGIQSYISAFDGKVFVTTSDSVYALDKDTGLTIWRTIIPSPGRWPAVYKIDDTHLVSGGSCLDIATGTIIWNSTTFSANANYFSVGVYSPEEKLFFVKNKAYIEAWNFSNPSVPPTLNWQTYVSGGANVGSGVQYGDGLVFPGSFEPHQMALEAKTGRVLWDVETTSAMIFSGAYSQGRFFRGGPFDNTLYAFNATTGAILWQFNPGTFDGYWCSGVAVAYGMVYGLNKDGHLYAVYAESGDLAWAYRGPGPLFFPGNPIVADGKVYATTGQASAFNPSTGTYSQSEFMCLDAYTGQAIWKMQIEAYPPRESTALAYGNLYLIPGFVKEQQMDEYVTFDQVWAIGSIAKPWSMWRCDPQHSAVGQSGPANVTLRWKLKAGGAVVSSPSAADGVVYFGSQDKNVYAVNSLDGSLIWSFATRARLASSPAVVDGRVYVGPDDGSVYCLDAYNGSLLWSTFAGGYVEAYFAAAVNLRSSPTVVDGKVYVGALDKKLYCLDARNGDVKWSFLTNGSITSSPAVVGGVAYIVSQEPLSGGLYMLDAANGGLIRRIAIPYRQASRGTDIHSSVVVANGMIFAASNKQAYYGINATTGSVVWTFLDPEAEEFIIASPIYLNGKVFLVDQFFIVALDAFTGSQLWKAFVGTEFYVSPTYAENKLYVTSDQRGLYVLNATDGSKVSFFATGSNSWSSPTLYEGKVYVGNNDWNVYCISEYPLLESNVVFDLAEKEVLLGESVSGCGYLLPGIANASIMLSLLKPDGAEAVMEVLTDERGFFDFTIKPEVVGDWTFSAGWKSDRSYYSSASSEHFLLRVTEPPPDSSSREWFETSAFIIVSVVAAFAIAGLGYFYLKRRVKKK